MKITLTNRSNKKRTKKARKKLKSFAYKVAKDLKLLDELKEIRLYYETQFKGYYPVNKPLHGFRKLFNNKVVTICFTQHWDLDVTSRKEAIVHELTHVKQMVEGRLKIRQPKTVWWNGKLFNKWKKVNIDDVENLSSKEWLKVRKKYLPWEMEVHKNCKVYKV